MITNAGARALGLGKDFGTLRPNAPADFVLVRSQNLDEIASNPIHLFQSTPAVERVYVRGEEA